MVEYNLFIENEKINRKVFVGSVFTKDRTTAARDAKIVVKKHIEATIDRRSFMGCRLGNWQKVNGKGRRLIAIIQNRGMQPIRAEYTLVEKRMPSRVVRRRRRL